ncbi:hypothetical protein [Staphylococcus phage vB_SsapH-Golestan-105-M]|nr:hypothetical protein [Staphylococcus phage vB_SsapH-Golestan-105-M]
MLITPILITILIIIVYSLVVPLILCGFESMKEYLKLVSFAMFFLTLSALPNILLWLGVL